MGLNVFNAKEIDFESTLIPAGTIVPVTIKTEGKIKNGTTNPENAFLDWEMVVNDGRYKGSKFFENVGIAGSEKFVELGHSKLKAVLETGRNARQSQDYEISNYGIFNGMQALVVVKIETYQKKDNSYGYKNTVAKYGSSNPASTRYGIFEYYSNGEQPFQTDEKPPLPQTAPRASQGSNASYDYVNEEFGI